MQAFHKHFFNSLSLFIKMIIAIPTMGRVDKQYTWKSIADHSPYEVVLVCPKGEHHPGKNYINCPRKGIAPTRQWIMQYFKDDIIVMMDDDLRFFRRRRDDLTKFTSDMSIARMLRKFETHMSMYAHGGIAMREGANRNTGPVIECARVARVIAYQRDIFFREKVDFRKSTVMDDFEVTLQLITKGYRNGIMNSYCQNQRGSGTVGGAAIYRTLEYHAQAAHRLAERYPEFVKAEKRKSKWAWGGQERTDVRVQWKKAFSYSQRP